MFDCMCTCKGTPNILINFASQAPTKVLPTMFQSGKTTFVKKAAPNDTASAAPAPAVVTTTTTIPTVTPVMQSASLSVMQTAATPVTTPRQVSVTAKQSLQQQKKVYLGHCCYVSHCFCFCCCHFPIKILYLMMYKWVDAIVVANFRQLLKVVSDHNFRLSDHIYFVVKKLQELSLLDDFGFKI